MRISDTMLQKLKHDYPEGTRVRLIRMDDPYSRLEPGEEGNVIGVDDIGRYKRQNREFDERQAHGILRKSRYRQDNRGKNNHRSSI